MKNKTLFIVCVFCVAMAALEAAVVVYLRELYYSDGFTVALKILDRQIMITEVVREAATMVMLICIAMLAGKTFKKQFAYFLISFAVWDLLYYLWLKIFIDWPDSLFDWDILFLIPSVWLAPVLAPVVCSLTMIVLASVLLKRNSCITNSGWALLGIGMSVILYTFLVDYGTIILRNGFYSDLASLLQNEEFVKITRSYIPVGYHWFLFVIGELFLLTAIFRISEKRTLVLDNVVVP